MEDIVEDVILSMDDGTRTVIKNVPQMILDNGERVSSFSTLVALGILVDLINNGELPKTVDYSMLIKDEEIMKLFEKETR